jgi:putative tricarboxylic transport membrane protein
MLLGAIMLHDVIPGPRLPVARPDFIPAMCAILFLASVAMLGCGFAMSKLTVWVVRTPAGILMPMVALFSVMGAFAIEGSMFTVYGMLAFGIVAYYLEEMGYPIAPLVIGLILGPMADAKLRTALKVSGGSVLPFFTRPIALLLVAAIVFSVFSQTPQYVRLKRRLRGGRRGGGA